MYINSVIEYICNFFDGIWEIYLKLSPFKASNVDLPW